MKLSCQRMVHFTHTGVVPRSGLGNQFPGQLAPLVDRNTIQLAETGPVLRLFNYISPDSIGKAPLYLQEFIKIGGVMPRAYKEQTQAAGPRVSREDGGGTLSAPTLSSAKSGSFHYTHGK